MTDKSEFDYWLNRDKDTYPVPSDDAVPGTSHMLREQFWFRHDSPSECRDRIIEIVACYPSRPLEQVSADRRDQIWECTLSILSETHEITEGDEPADVKEALDNAISEAERAAKFDAERAAKVSASQFDQGVTFFRWQHASGYRCFVNREIGRAHV